MARKTYVIDTNVLLYDPESILQFPDSDVVIPLVVLEELDKMKRVPGELGKNSRAVVRYLVNLKDLGKGNLHEGVALENGCLIKLVTDIGEPKTTSLCLSIADNKILLAALYFKEEVHNHVVFVSKDFAARIKAEAIGLEAQDYEFMKFSYDTIYKGVRRVEVSKQVVDTFYKDQKVSLPDLDCGPNEYVVLTSPEHSSAVGKFDTVKKILQPLLNISDVWGVTPRNVEQRCAMDALLRDDIKLVTLMGPAGTGKTLLALACALKKVFDEGLYNKILISRPIVPLGRDIGYLPGTKEEKLHSWMQPIFDNLEFLCNPKGEGSSDTLHYVIDSEKIEMEAVTYIRGRSLPRMFMIIDEAQNLTPHEVKTIVSRAGEGTKVVLAGDATQIDNPYLDQDSNGLTYTAGRFWEQKLFSQIFLDKTERSELAALAADVM